jgi:hypothetical protein
MIGSCNEYGFEKPWLFTQEIGKKRRIQGLNASIAPVIG